MSWLTIPATALEPEAEPTPDALDGGVGAD
jgi:hypothetical protein